jgi:excisionase family DNA binding protein
MSDELPKLLTLPEAADIIAAAGAKVSKEYLRRQIKAGALKARKFGAKWCIAEADLIEWANRPAEPAPRPAGTAPTGAKNVDYAAMIRAMVREPQKKRR